MRAELGDENVDALRTHCKGRAPGGANLVRYWFEKARAQIKAGKTARTDLLATQGIRGGANRTALERVFESGGFFMAWNDHEWILDGANVLYAEARPE